MSKPSIKYAPALPAELAAQLEQAKAKGANGVATLYDKVNHMLLVAALGDGELAAWTIQPPVGEEYAQQRLDENPGVVIGDAVH